MNTHKKGHDMKTNRKKQRAEEKRNVLTSFRIAENIVKAYLQTEHHISHQGLRDEAIAAVAGFAIATGDFPKMARFESIIVRIALRLARAKVGS